MTETRMLASYIAVIALVAGFAVLLNQWDSSAPTIYGWTEIQARLTTSPWGSMPAAPSFFPPSGSVGAGVTCAWWDLACHSVAAGASIIAATAWIAAAIFYIGGVIFYVLQWIAAMAVWMSGVLVPLLVVIFSAGTLTLTGMPIGVQVILWVIIAPFYFILLWHGIPRFVEMIGSLIP